MFYTTPCLTLLNVSHYFTFLFLDLFLPFVHINLAQKPDIYRFASDPSVTSSVFVPRFRLFFYIAYLPWLSWQLMSSSCAVRTCSSINTNTTGLRHSICYAVLPKPNPDIRYKVETAQEAPVPC